MNEKTPNSMTRRQFMRQGVCAAVGTSSLLSTILNLRQLNAATISNSDIDGYKALICIFLYGGNDASNLLVPYDLNNYNIYAQGRQQLTLQRDSLIKLNINNSDGRDFALHPSMQGTSELFEQGNLALVSNVGTLIAPVTLQDFRNGSPALPPHLFSHSDQQVLWQTSVPHESNAYSPTGWGGRIADLLHSVHNNSSVSMLVSLSGNNFFQVGETLLPYRTSNNGSSIFRLGHGSNERDTARFNAFKQMLDQDYGNLMEDAFADISNNAINDADTFNTAIADANDFAMIPNSSLGNQLRSIAKIIQKHEALGMKRQIFFAATGGFDTHGPQLGAHAGLLGGIDSAMKGFNDALTSINMQDSATTFTASDFGRTFDSNGRGSDHGWGSHHLVMGGAVKGKQIYGNFPELALGASPQDAGRGRWIPTTSVDQYGATLAKWFGVSDTDLPIVFPNINNFATADLGFMS